MRKCETCGAELPKNDTVCDHCGSDNAISVNELVVNDGTLVISEGTTLTLTSKTVKTPDQLATDPEVKAYLESKKKK